MSPVATPHHGRRRAARARRRRPFDLDERVAERTRELATGNEALTREIAELRTALAKLHESESNARVVLDGIPGLVAILAPDGSVEFVNRQIMEYCGRSLAELKDWASNGTVHADDMPRVAETFGASIAAGTSYEIQQRLRRHDGAYRWFDNRGVPVRDAAGTIARWYVLLTDVHDRKQAEETIAASERIFRQTFNAIPTLAWCNRTDGSNEFLNQRWHDYTGLSPAEANGWGWQIALHPDDLPGLLSKWSRMLQTGESGELEARLRRHDGVYRWFLFRCDPLRDDQGNVIKWYGTNTDIEDLKNAEAELRRAHDSIADAQRLSHTGSFVTDLTADDHHWSAETYRIFEFEPGTKITAERIRSIVHADDLASFDAMIARALTGENVDFLFRILTASGLQKHVKGRAHVVEQAAGRPMFVGALQDVTESRLAEEALDKARSDLTHAARAMSLGVLTASIAHEVSQPLSGIITNANTCLRMLGADPPNIEGALETARRTMRDGNRASEVITRLRALFSKRDFAAEAVDLNAAARELISLSLHEIRRRRIFFHAEFEDDLPLVIGDRVQLQQVILNLLLNASDALQDIDDRPRQILLQTAREDQAARVSVRDTGIGVASEANVKLFSAFYTTKSEGMGIGLSVSRAIIERHNGRLWASANDGPGATFSFTVPSRSTEQLSEAAPWIRVHNDVE